MLKKIFSLPRKIGNAVMAKIFRWPVTRESSGGSPAGVQMGWFNLENALFTYSAAFMVGTLAEIKNVAGSWDTAVKVLFGALTLGTIGSLAFGLVTAVGYHKTGKQVHRKISAFCARFSTIVSTALFIIVTSCLFGRVGRLAGYSSAALIASIMIVLWVWIEWSAVKAALNFLDRPWLRLPRRQPVAPHNINEPV